MKANELITLGLLLLGSAVFAYTRPTAWLALLIVFGGFALVWALSVRLKDASILDIAWGPGFVLAAGVYLWQAPEWTERGLLISALVALWGLRLGAHIGLRKRGHGEDKRYQQFRQNGGASYWWKSLFTVFGLQAWMLWVISMPLAGAIHKAAPLNAIDAVAVALFAFGFLFEAIADWQLTRFKASNPPKGALMTTGLWSRSRHPNYFGETVLWWGFGLFAVAAGHPQLLLGPLLITFMLLRVSGVTMLEQDMAKRPGYAEYARQTPAFVPRLSAPPRSR
jgi:steroid 5-alpha reductase family enzyme